MELMVVIFVLALTVVVVLPKFPSTDGAKLRSSAASLAAAIRTLGDRSIMTKNHYRMSLSLFDGQVTISRIDSGGQELPPDDLFLKRRLLAEGVIIKDVDLPRKGKITASTVAVDFDVNGLNEFMLIHLQGAHNSYFTIVAFPENGKVKVLEGYQEMVL
jgi:general secretion pathway protein H